MEFFKVEDFKRYHKIEFPFFKSLTEEECAGLFSLLKNKLGLPSTTDGVETLTRIRERSKSVEDENVGREDFSIALLAKGIGITALEEVYINWYRFDRVDKLKFSDLDRYFYDIWYPGMDDIEVFDDTFSWIISISHSGTASCLEL